MDVSRWAILSFFLNFPSYEKQQTNKEQSSRSFSHLEINRKTMKGTIIRQFQWSLFFFLKKIVLMSIFLFHIFDFLFHLFSILIPKYAVILCIFLWFLFILCLSLILNFLFMLSYSHLYLMMKKNNIWFLFSLYQLKAHTFLISSNSLSASIKKWYLEKYTL